MLSPPRPPLRWGLALCGLLSVAYSLSILLVVATAPDLRLRWLLVDSQASQPGEPEMPTGVRIRYTDDVIARGPTPETGDLLLSIEGTPVRVSLAASQQVLALGQVAAPSPEVWMGGTALPPNWVDVEFWSHRDQTVHRTQLAVQPVPAAELGITLAWLVCQLGILALSALAFWKRPFDRPARLFFAMCTVTLAAFVGGFHWWLLSGSFLLSLPFVVCAVLVPSVTLHFFLTYPRPKAIYSRWREASLWGLYGPPILAATGFVLVEWAIWRHLAAAEATTGISEALWWLGWLRAGIYGYLIVAAAYFIATLATLLHSVLTTHPILERRQVTSILWAALIASVFIGYTLVLACWDRVAFALGGARVPMFLASLVFMFAYAVGIVRYKLMLSDEMLHRGFLAELARMAGALVFALIVVPVVLAIGRQTADLPTLPYVTVGLVLLLLAMAVLVGRDRLQRWMERRLFRERYRLEKALQRIHRAVGQFADPQFLSERTLAACCEVLQAEWAALYLRDSLSDGGYQLSGVAGDVAALPMTWTPSPAFLQALDSESGIIAGDPNQRGGNSTVESDWEHPRGELFQLLEIDGEPAGLVILGPKQAGSFYTPEDGTFLTALTQLTGVALHCVRVHQDLTQLNEQMRLKVERIAQQKQQILLLQAELAATREAPPPAEETGFRRDAIKGQSPALVQVLETARKAAISDATVLIRGESGTGKELLARAIHENSARRNGPFVAVHCAALASGLLESELFGHVKGAFTGAVGDKRGRFELAGGGTLFLDEVGEIPLETQVKLLRALQQREIEPVGGSAPVAVDIRLVAATHRNLEQMIAEGRFREDLYYRLNVISLTLPALRERREDLHELAAEFLRRAAEKCDKPVLDFEETALDALLRYDWPGNIRELENVIERAVVLADGDLISLADLPGDIQVRTGAASRTARASLGDAAVKKSRAAVEQLARPSWRSLEADDERRLLLDALQRTAGNKARAARLLGLPRSTFFSKLKKHSLAD